MKILILQLSDIHFRANKNFIDDRINQIKSAVQAADSSFSTCFIAVTGDVAWSGQQAEYEAAQDFFSKLHYAITSIRSDLRVEKIFIPGNHDCDLSQSNYVRQVLINDALINAAPPYKPNEEVITTCIEVQNNFFNFASKHNPQSHELKGYNRLYYVKDYILEERRVLFNCYNTAWMSQINEQQGKLLIPTDLIVDDVDTYDLVVTLFHHPYNWIEANNAKAFRKLVEQHSDVIMVGHEHVADQYSKRTIRGELNIYFEGAVLQDNSASESGFNIIILNLESQEHRLLSYSWNQNHYSLQQENEWQIFNRHKRLKSKQFENTAEFVEQLVDPGATFTHPNKSTITLGDIFIYPDFRDKSFTQKQVEDVVRGEQILECIREYHYTLIAGGDKAGKTTLSKLFYIDLQKSKLVPILISGDLLKNHDETSFLRLIDKSVASQYGQEMVEHYQQLDKSYKVLLVDDIHQSNLNRRGLNKIIHIASNIFGYVIVFADDFFELGALTDQSNEQSTLLSFRQYEIQELGHRLRGRLIEKWYNLGQEFTGNEIEIARKTANVEHVINTLLGKNLLPSYPIFILSLLQSYEAGTNHNTNLGTYGYHYEALITAALTVASKNVGKRITLDTMYTFLSKIAYRMFEQNQKFLTELELDQVAREYQTQYKMPFRSDVMMRVLEEARMIKRTSDDKYRFMYKYIYYYFVAKYIAENLHTTTRETDLRQKIKSMTDKIHVEDHSNIILFLVYLTKDEKTITQILMDAKEIYVEYEPSDLDQDIIFLTRLSKLDWPSQLQLDSKDPQHNKDEYRRRLDEADQRFHEDEDEDDNIYTERDIEDDEEGRRQIENILKINVAFKTLQIMGQILRNFPGALHGDVKLQIATESYLLGLRSLRAMLLFFENNLDQIRGVLFEFLKDELQTEDQEEIANRTDELIYLLTQMTAYTFIKRVSQSVGSEYLEETYKEVIEENSPVSIRLIDASIKLDHFSNFPKSEMIDLYGKLRNIPFAAYLLRKMVRDHLYLYPIDIRTRHSICHKLNIKINDPKLFDTRDRKVQ